jgi:hypothetical protein
LLCFLCAFCDFAPLREMLLLVEGLFHSFCRRGPQSIGPDGPEQVLVQGKLNEAEYTAHKVLLKTSRLKAVFNEKPPAKRRWLNFRTLWEGASFAPTIWRQARTDSVASAKAAPVAQMNNAPWVIPWTMI